MFVPLTFFPSAAAGALVRRRASRGSRAAAPGGQLGGVVRTAHQR
ncbi:hypothetical protein [Streptomyces pratensis]|nr:hypothetical protein [Streptomyces pratensis]